MRLTSGRHRGKTLEVVVLKAPDFVEEIFMSKPRNATQTRVLAETKRLTDVFNRRSIEVRCVGMGCERRATRCSIYKSDILNPWWWCDACDPWQYGVGREMIRIIRTYQEVLEFSEVFDDPTVARDLVRTLAAAKGLLGPKEPQADDFFNG